MLSTKLIYRTKPAILMLLILPSLLWVGMFINGTLGINPIQVLMDKLGEMALRLIILTLLVSSLSQIKYLRSLQNLRRLIGLTAFYYVLLHLMTYVFLDHFFNFSFILLKTNKHVYLIFLECRNTNRNTFLFLTALAISLLYVYQIFAELHVDHNFTFL